MKFAPGDIATTTNSRVPALNGGLLVVVTDIHPTRVDHNGERTPYGIRRIDGQRFVCSSDPRTGQLRMPGDVHVYAREDQLVKPDLREGWTDQEAIEQRGMQRAMEAAMFSR